MTFTPDLVQPNCPLCGGHERRTVLQGRDRLHGLPGEFGVVRCLSCDLLFTSPRPEDRALPRYYPADYEPYESTTPRTPDARRCKDRLRLVALVERFGYPRALLGDAPAPRWQDRCGRWWSVAIRRPPFRLPPWRGDGRALDVGCGAGGYLLRLRAMGWTVAGLDLSPTAVARARAKGLDVFEGDLARFPDHGRRFDLVRLASVLEHVPDPVATLRRAGELLSPGGAVQLVLPNAASFTFRRFGSFWFPLDLPRHLQHFTPATLAATATRARLRVVELRQASGPRDITRSLAYRWPRLAAWSEGRVARRLLSPVAAVLDRLGVGDSMEVTLERAAD